MVVELYGEEFEVLNYLDIYYEVSSFEDFNEALDLSEEKIIERLRDLKEKELVEGKWKITSEGKKAIDAHRRKIVKEMDREEEFLDLCHKFEEANSKFKHLVTEYQIQKLKFSLSGEKALLLILDQLNEIHEEVIGILEEISDIFPPIRRYPNKLTDALKKLRKGNMEYLVAQKKSYHNIWYEFHEYLLKLSGIERKE